MKEREIRWKKSISNDRYFGNDFEEWMAFVSKVLLDVVCAFLFVYSARLMLEDVYNWAELSSITILKLFFVAVIVSMVMEFAIYAPKKPQLLLKCGLLLVGIIICISCFKINERQITSGMQKMISCYIEDWNLYYKSAIYYDAGKLQYITDALDYITIVLFFGLLWLAKLLKHNLIMVVLPAVVLIVELLVGFSPEYQGLILCFAAVLMSNAFKWIKPDFGLMPGANYVLLGSVRVFTWVLVGVSVFFLNGVVRVIVTPMTEELVTYSADVKEWFTETLESIEEVAVWEGTKGNGVLEKATLTNEPPQYSNEDILRFELKKKPVNAIYLKGFCGDNYDAGQWNYSSDAFKKACKEAGYKHEELSAYVLSLGTKKLYDGYQVESFGELDCAQNVTITYLAKANKKVYLPYFIEINPENIIVTGDGYYHKKKDADEISFLLWDYESDYRGRLNFSQEGANSEWEKWYRSYVMEHYLEVPEHLSTVMRIAENLSDMQEGAYLFAGGKNQKRMDKADLVVQWMENNTSYSTYLPELPKDSDPIEYFLKESRKGYCMHYASASVMILRAMGVPARYASGYIIEEDSVKAEALNYCATVKGSNAHAWVEIYLDDIGWVPIEVTKGYSVSVDDDTSVEVTPTVQPATSSSVNATTAPTVKPSKAPDEAASEMPKESKKPGETKTEGKNGDSSQGHLSSDSIKIIGFVVGSLTVAGVLIAWTVVRYKANYHRRLLSLIRRQRTLRVIKLINYRIYRKVRGTDRVRKGSIGDDEYKKMLIENYPEIPAEVWERYMDIVKAAAFSRREFSVEEMNFCYEIYRKVTEK